MHVMRTLRLGSAVLLATGLMTWSAAAQEFSAGEGFTDYVRRTCGALSGLGEAGRSTQQEDLFRRCNGALNAPGTSTDGLTGQGDILDQYLGSQSLAPQSDGFNRANRPDKFVTARLKVVASQMRGGQFALHRAKREILLASNDAEAVSHSSTLSRSGKWDGFASLGAFQTDQDTTTEELGHDQDGFWVAGGVDYNFNDKLVAGAALSYVDTDADFASVGGLDSGGQTESENLSVTFYASYLPNENWNVNGTVSVGQADFDTSRDISIVDKNGGGINAVSDGNFATVNRTATSSAEADTLQVSIGAARPIYLENGVTVTPSASVSYYNASVDGFSETGSNGLDLVFDEQEVNSTQIAIGATLSRAVSTDWAVIVPYGRANALFELQDSEQSVVARYAVADNPNDNFVIRTNPADESVVDLALGATAQFAGGMSAFAEYSTVLGLDNVDHHALTVGVRHQF